MTEYKVTIDPSTGEFVFVLETADGRICPYCVISTKTTKAYCGYHLILKDLKLVKEAFDQLKKAAFPEQILKLSLLSFAIVTYGKCYAQSKGRKIQLNSADSLNGLNDTDKATHLKLIEMRNSYFAHSGEGDFEKYPFTLNLNPDLDRKQILGYMINGMQQINHDLFLDSYLNLIDHVLRFTEAKISKVQAKLDNEISELKMDEVYKSSVLPDRAKLLSINELNLNKR